MILSITRFASVKCPHPKTHTLILAPLMWISEARTPFGAKGVLKSAYWVFGCGLRLLCMGEGEVAGCLEGYVYFILNTKDRPFGRLLLLLLIF